MNGIVSALDDFDAKTMIDTIKRRKEAADRTTEINRILKHSMSEEDVNAFAQKENEILKKKDDLTRQLFEAQHMLEDIGRELQIKEQIRDKAMQTLKSNAQNKAHIDRGSQLLLDMYNHAGNMDKYILQVLGEGDTV